ncbi:hypothetical protein DDQ50_16375 [Amnibacterium flavum]|uniref:Uncharacterized protein n=1 Tax=Amnibacterium flavum TaxID=2173173 RepID=A0A2V1HT63_9MICO|nr:hypothetical protein DDQ50_16375 [Amnibacterium flavum]
MGLVGFACHADEGVEDSASGFSYEASGPSCAEAGPDGGDGFYFGSAVGFAAKGEAGGLGLECEGGAGCD